MANTNAIIEKVKEFGLRHGEKVGLAVASMVFFVCLGMAANQTTIGTTPEQVKRAAQQSESNLSRPEKREIILQKLGEKGIKESDFTKVVEEQVNTAIVPDEYKPAREWVTAEPGAGLIRDTPTLIAVTELYAYPGRGGILIYDLDESGNRIPETDKDKVINMPPRRHRKRASRGGGMAQGGRATKKKSRRSSADIAREVAEEDALAKRKLEGKMVGGDRAEQAENKDEKEDAPEGPSKEITKGYRWVVVTGVLDHAKLIANYREALKNPAAAHPNYRRLDLQRQVLQPDGSWTQWENVSTDARYKVLDNLPEVDEELTPNDVRPTNLVDPLPFLKAGLWEKVHIASLVPKEKKEISKPNNPSGGGPMRGIARAPGNTAGEAMPIGKMGGGMMAGGMTASSESLGDWRSGAQKVMVRAFDFTVKEDESYRYRVRIVVFNPNKGREDVSPGVDSKSEELRGPWSPDTDQVGMPPDVMPYAMGTSPMTAASDVKVQFQVIRFNPSDGVTVYRNFDASAGELIGESRTVDVPVSDGSGKKPKLIDFNSHQIMLDLFANKRTGGYQHLPPGFIGPPILKPALALVLRPDGSVVLHNQTDDEANDVRKDIEANYKHEISESTKKRERGTGTGAMGSGGRRRGR